MSGPAFGPSGLAIQTFNEILAEVQDDWRLNVASNITTKLGSTAGQVQRIMATRELQQQEKMLELYQSFDARLAEGVNLDIRTTDSVGAERIAQARAEVLGTATFSAAATLTDGLRLSVGGFEFSVIGGPYIIAGAGTIPNVRLQSTLYETIDVSVLGAWTIVDTVAGFDSFSDTSQPIGGNVVESDAAYRVRAETERFTRATGQLRAIEASVSQVIGVTYVRAWHNVDPALPTDANGIDYQKINVVVDGGDDTLVAIAIENAAPAGTTLQGTDVSISLGSGVFTRVVSFDRVTIVTMWEEITVTTSTSEETPLDGPALEAAVVAAVAARATVKWQIGTDVVPVDLVSAIGAAGIPAIDSIVVLLSIDDGAGDAYSAVKRAIGISERAQYSAARITVTEI